MLTGSDPAGLADAYAHCRRLNARHGRTFYLATGLLPAAARPHVHALYGFARYADDVVDHPTGSPEQALAELAVELERGLAGEPVEQPVVRAVSATAARFGLERRLFADFLAAMAADLTVRRYPTFTDLRGYMWGSASVIGLQMLPILGVTGDRAVAERCASELGVAFQLTNFLRDVGEDYRRGRIYLPQQTLAEHRVTEPMFAEPVTPAPLRAAVAAELARARECYQQAVPGVGELHPAARDCIRTAATLYGGILDEIERADYDVLSRRVAVGLGRRLRVGGAGYLRAVRARRRPAVRRRPSSTG